MLRLTILGSGSGGNCACIESPTTRLLVDAGFSAKQIRKRLAQIELEPENFDGILLTHEHTDHIAGLPVLCEKLNLPLYCNPFTADFLRPRLPTFSNWKLFETGQSFAIGDLTIESFSVPHDACDPVGFVVHNHEISVGFLTDLGHVTRLITERVRSCHALVLETNYDQHLLQNDPRRPWAIKQRILSRHGHLSNENAAKLVSEIATEKLHHLFLGHLSSDCNTPELALAAVDHILKIQGVHHVKTRVASQTQPSETVMLNKSIA